MWNFIILTFGCKVNQYESQSVREHWQTCGGVETDDAAQADIALINSCAITARAERDARAALYRLEREAPHCRRILTGCSAELLAQDPKLRALCHVLVPVRDKSLLLTDPRTLTGVVTEGAERQAGVQAPPAPAEIHTLSANAGHVSTGSTDTIQANSLRLAAASGPRAASGCAPASTFSPPEADTAPCTSDADMPQGAYPPFSIRAFRRARPVLKVQEGCTHRCTYCIVPTVRSVSSSRPVTEAVAEARRLLEAGYREIMISGINLLLYGRDFSEPADFWSLIAALERELAPEWAGRARFRISSLEPKQLRGRGLELLAESRMLCPHLHISLQSGSPAVLRRMGRGHYRPEMLTDAVTELTRAWPRFALGADILMGFPGEQEEHVRETLALVDALPFTYAHVFPYSRRPGTAADRFPDQIPQPEKAARAARVRGRVHEKQLAFWQRTVQEQPELLIALDSPENHKTGSTGKGIDQCYVPCQLENAPACGHELVRARAVRLTPEGIMARRI